MNAALTGKSQYVFLRNNPLGHPMCRSVTRSPVDFRQGRRASDGLVAQGISSLDNCINSVAFNSQRLQEACKTKGVLELHLLQQEAASLSSQYQSCVPLEEMNVRQQEHRQFHVTPIKIAYEQNAMLYQCGYKSDDLSFFNRTVSGITTDISNYVSMMKIDDYNGIERISMNLKNDSQSLHIPQSQLSIQKPPLQQQLMQHRLLQQKRQILQKQGAMEACLSSRRQMLRQQSYKIAQNQQILPPLPFPLSEKESEDLLAFQQIVENQQMIDNPKSPTFSCSLVSPSNVLKTTHLHYNQPSPPLQLNENGAWANLPTNFNSCQINEISASHELCNKQVGHQVNINISQVL